VQVLIINCGSSTLKFQIVDVDTENGDCRISGWLVEGAVERIGQSGSIKITVNGGKESSENIVTNSHNEAMGLALDRLGSLGYLGKEGVQAVGHRVVQGGDHFIKPTLIDVGVIEVIEGLVELAPLHNRPSVEAIRSAWERLGPDLHMVATFDTLFHRSLPARASLYPIPLELSEKHQIKRFGAHGLAHRYMTERYTAITATPTESVNLITLQLGSGCSATAVQGGRSVDTSMGLTPLEGLMMGTRTGDVDPSLVGYLARSEGVTTEVVEDWLNRRSGLLGVSGSSQDVRDLLEAEQRADARAALAIEMFCYRVRKYIGAYIAALGGADAVIFGGGIGENSPLVRQRICVGMERLGLSLDSSRNNARVGTEGRISDDKSSIQAYVIPVNEAEIIARDTVICLRDAGKQVSR
jgi:acetate kinase